MPADFSALSLWLTLSAPVCASYAVASVNRTVIDEPAPSRVSLVTLIACAVPASVAVVLAATPTDAVATLVLASALIYLAAFDLRFMAVPVWPVLGFTAIGVAFGLLGGVEIALQRAGAALAGWSAFVLLDQAYRLVRGRSGLGGGDALVAALLGAWLSLEGLSWSVAIGSACGAAWAISHGRLRGRELPLVPALALGAGAYMIAKGME